MLSTPAMNVVATAPSPGVSTPRRPVAGRGAGRLPAEEEACTNAISLSAARRVVARGRVESAPPQTATACGRDVTSDNGTTGWRGSLSSPFNLSLPLSGEQPAIRAPATSTSR